MHATCQEQPRTVSNELIDFARRQLVNATLFSGDDRRAEHRHLMLVPVWVVPVDEDNQPIGEPVQLITRDVSASSIGLFHEDEITHDRLALHMRLASTDVNLVIRVIWVQPAGPFYGLAGTYLERLDRFPVDIPGR